MSQIKFPINRISKFLRKYTLWIAGGIFLLLFIYTAYLYYVSVYSLMDQGSDLEKSELGFKKEAFERVSLDIQKRKDLLKETQNNSYSNPFAD